MNFSFKKYNHPNFFFDYRKVIFFLLLFANTSYAQKQYTLQIKTIDKEKSTLKKILPHKTITGDSIYIISQLKNIISQFQGAAYLAASIDKLTLVDSMFTAHIFVGDTYEWASLKNGNVTDAFLSQVGFRERLYQKKPFHYQEVQQLISELLSYAENHGYPFASVQLGEIKIDGNRIAAKIFMQLGRVISFEGVKIEGEAVKISEQYLENYLGIKKGTPYSHTKILKIKDRIRELPFLKQKRNATVSFLGNKATVNLYLDKKKSSRWDLLFGLLPGNGTDAKLQFTGSATLDFQNQFGLGEKIFIDFQRLRPETQEIELRFSYPYVLNLPFGFDFKFEQYRRDSSFNDVGFDLGIQYLFTGGNYLKAFWENRSSSLITINTQFILNAKTLPANLDYSHANFGLEYDWQKLDYRFNPRKGWGITLRAGAGFKTTKKNNTILGLKDEANPDFRFASLYDSLQLNSFQYKIENTLTKYLPILQNSTLKLSTQMGFIISKQGIYKNEQFRIGGNRLLRGFDEQSVFATKFAVATLEYRLLIDQNSFFFVFGDYAYIVDKTLERTLLSNLLGFGVGMSFYAQKVGLISLSLAWPKVLGTDVPLRFNDARIHLGYKSFF